MSRTKVTLLRDRPPNFAGETIFVDSALASTLVNRKQARLYGSRLDGQPSDVTAIAGKKQESTENSPKVSQDVGSGASNVSIPGQRSVFEFDGFSQEVAAALAEAGIRNQGDLSKFVEEGKKLSTIKGVTKKIEADLTEFYLKAEE